MEAFTFATLTYNQENYILEHLESVRYQIEHYGQKTEIYYVLADDCSSDRTVELAQKWLNKNRRLFKGIEIITVQKNQGIVRNYEQALRHITTNHFKLLAGDDLYYCEDIFEAAKQGDFVMCPVVCFGENGVDRKSYRFRFWTHKEWIDYGERNFKKKLMKRIKVKNCIVAPGVIWNHALVDEGLFEELKQFHWIEDYPSWNYILSKDTVIPIAYDKPIVLYRMNQGISHRKTVNKRKKNFDEELIQQYKCYGSPFAKIPREFHPYAYWYYLCYYMKACWYWLCADRIKKKLITFDKRMELVYNNTDSFIQMIRKNAEECY